ncbi:39S ribosomal protein L40, mitochondrial [Thrips palmi]|uniref:Large ribosomal subunit protein mL40 n=1 Tax=Thrips palmi TaxID=161013 RepID=A0A6P8YX83_THRPL|nr:39S ribosomal protein L40, mitochondrial [Thrips palmi]
MSLSNIFSRLAVGAGKQYGAVQTTRSISVNSPLYLRPTQCLYKEPLKRRKFVLDQNTIKVRDERKKRKIEKEIKRLQKFTATLKPIEEQQLPLHIQDEYEQRQRPETKLTPEEDERRALLMKQWSRHRALEHKADVRMIERIQYSQQLALDKLREESEELYQAAIKIDAALVPVTIKGPTVTPPLREYDSPDGDFNNTSFKWG